MYLFKNYDRLKEPAKHAQNMDLTYYDENGNIVNSYEGEGWAYKIFVDATGQRFLLKNKSQSIPDWAKGKYDIVIDVPLENVVVISSTHIALMMPLNDEVLMDLGTIIHPEAFKGRTTHFFLRYYPESNTAEPYTAG